MSLTVLVPLWPNLSGPALVEVSARALDSGGNGADDGEAVKNWVSQDGGFTLTQATSGNRPNADDDQYPGRWSVVFQSGKYLQATPPGPIKWFMIIAVPGTRGAMARDTSAVTTKPAFEVVLEAV